MAFVDVQLQGDKELKYTLAKLDHHLTGVGILSFMQGVIDPWQQNAVARRFAAETDPAGHGWTPLSEPAVAERESEGYGGEHPILRRTGELQSYIEAGGTVDILGLGAQITYPGEGGGSDAREKYEVNQEGTMDGQHHFGWRVPPRPMLGWVPADLVEVMAFLEVWVWQGLV